MGAGPVGMTAALLLVRRGMDVTVLERHAEPYPLPRAVHLDGEAVDILRGAGVLEPFLRISRAMPGLRLVDAGHRVLAEFRRAPVGRFGHPDASLFDQPALDAVLAAALPDGVIRRGVDVVAVEPGPVVVCADGTRIAAEAVLGCDGADSVVRRSLGIGVRELRPAERWLVVDAVSPEPVDMWDGVHQVCAERPATFMRVVGDRYRWEFRLRPGEDGGSLSPPDGPTVIRRAVYTFHARVAERWRLGRVFLLGDAAHLTPPFAGQGLGAGLRDAVNLAWKLDYVLDRGAPDELLDTYQAERLPHALTTIRAARLLGWAMTGGRARQRLLRAAAHLPMAEVAPRLRGGPLVRRGGGKVLPGASYDDFAVVGNRLVRPDGVVAGTARTASGLAALTRSVNGCLRPSGSRS
ncbi:MULTISPECIES: FAD-dependent monooxygenase [Actinokineospora]|uniref:FAD-dependent monooxygenase n=1 Tax=Actinokineospora TaxID=39845 RepID=UPI001670452D|nr:MULTISPECIES: FAD-dependent monooxygenase [Actinokineospora]